MRIDGIRFKNCNRFALGGHDDLIVKPKAMIQMIVGTNGSGKSSFADMAFSPLTPSHHDFKEGGLREWNCTKDGKSYQLSSVFDTKRHSFIVDGTELNPGHTVTVQNQLVAEHFNYDKTLHDILTGQTKFTSMSAVQRSNAISKISNVDFSYAFSKFAEWRRGYNSSNSVVKFLGGRLAEEKGKLISEEDKASLRENVARLTKNLEDLRSLDRPIEFNPSYDGGVTINNLITKFHRNANHFLSLELPVLKDGTREATQSYLDIVSHDISKLEKSIFNMSGNLARAEASRERILKRLQSSDIPTIEAEVADAHKLLATIPEKNIDVPDEWLVRCDPVISAITHSLNAMNSSPLESLQEYQVVANQMNESILNLNKANSMITHLSERVTELTSEKEVSCPSCSFTFRPGVNQEDIKTLQARILKGQQYVLDLDKKNQSTMERYHELATVKDANDNLIRIRNEHYDKARGLFSYIDSLGGFNKGRELISALSLYNKEVEYRERREMIKRGLEHSTLALEAAKGATENLDIVIKEYDDLTKEYETLSRGVDVQRSLRDTVGKDLSHYDHFVNVYEGVMEDFKSIGKEVMLTLGGLYRSILDEEIGRLQTGLAINVNALSDNDVIETIIKDLDNQMTKAKVEAEAFKVLMDAMDPKTGLIAEQIRVQIGTIVDGMNNMIAAVWNYPLTLDLPSEEDGKLNYKFPMYVDGEFRDDISKGSSSMKAIINTTFSILAHYSLGLQGFPVYLDEFDGTFDGVHSENVVKLVKDLADSGRFNHVVIISHDEKIQKAFPMAEVLILDGRNLEEEDKHVNIHKLIQEMS